jgi:hypothetical protein
MNSATSPLIGAYLHKTECTLEFVLPVLDHFGLTYRTFGREVLAELKPGDFDVLLFGGGWYSFDDKTNDNIRAFVREGGGYVGICCGQIVACKIGLINADVLSMLGIGPTEVIILDGDHPVMKDVAKRREKEPTRFDNIDMLRFNGFPMILKDGAHMIGCYDRDRKLAAIATAECGKGRVVGFSPHPEGKTCEPGLFKDRDKLALVYDGIAMGTAKMIDNAIRWTAKQI